MKNNGFKGLGVAMVTPFNEDGNLDFAGLQKLTEHLIEGGVDYLVVHGTTGESPVLSKEEKRSSMDFILEVNAGRVPVVIGIGGNDTRAIVEHIEQFNFDGIDGILSVSPAYNKPTQEGIYQHFKAISECTDMPIILYNVPGRTSSNMTAETTLRLAKDFSNVVAIKEASNDINQIAKIIEGRPDGFLVLSGDDGITLSLMASGADGLISVAGNAFTKDMSALVHAGARGDQEAARKIHFKLIELIELLFVEGNPAGIKEVLKYLNICQTHLRLPLVPVSKATSQSIYKAIAEAELVLLKK